MIARVTVSLAFLRSNWFKHLGWNFNELHWKTGRFQVVVYSLRSTWWRRRVPWSFYGWQSFSSFFLEKSSQEKEHHTITQQGHLISSLGWFSFYQSSWANWVWARCCLSWSWSMMCWRNKAASVSSQGHVPPAMTQQPLCWAICWLCYIQRTVRYTSVKKVGCCGSQYIIAIYDIYIILILQSYSIWSYYNMVCHIVCWHVQTL